MWSLPLKASLTKKGELLASQLRVSAWDGFPAAWLEMEINLDFAFWTSLGFSGLFGDVIWAQQVPQ